MKGKVLINFWDSWTTKSDKAWLPWLTKKLADKGIEATFSFNSSPIASTISTLQSQFNISEEQTTIAFHNPGVLTILRYIEKLIAHNIDKSLLVAGIPRGFLNAPKAQLLLKDSVSRALTLPAKEKALKQFQPGFVLVWLSENIAKPDFSGSIRLTRRSG